MKIKHLQLNTSILRSPEKVMQFIKDFEIDIACLQEVVYQIGKESPLQELAKESGYFYQEAVDFEFLPNSQVIAEAIISKLPIVDYQISYYNSENYEPKVINEKDLIGSNILADNETVDNFPGSRGLKHWLKSRAILNALVDTGNGFLRAITTHYTVSDHCTETLQMYEMSKMVKSMVKYSNSKIPTIFSGDLNIRAESYSVSQISEIMECHTKNFIDTLSEKHVARQHGFPKGLAIDHVFSRGLKHIYTKSEEIEFSEHKAIVSEFEK